jgi:hypothetical protein
VTATLVEPACRYCGIPADASYFDSSRIAEAPEVGEEIVLAEYQLHPSYCGVLNYFAQFTDRYAQDPSLPMTPDLHWQIRCNGQPRDPYVTFDRIINPWGLSGFPIHLRLEEGCLVQFVVRRVAAPPPSVPGVILLASEPAGLVGGRLLGRYWYNPLYGGTR